MSTQKIPAGVLRSAFGVADKMPPLTTEKDPVLAAVAGFFSGGIGLGLYLRSWPDFYIPWLMLIVLLVLSIPMGGLPAFFAPFFWAAFAYRRVKASNAKLEFQTDVREAEIVAPPFIRDMPPLPTTVSFQARLRQLDDLLAAGVLTQAERDTKRAKILADL
jgi:hypothetical protein